MGAKLRYFLAGLGLVFTLVVGVVLSYPDSNLHLIFCDVGQGDAILMIKGQTQVLVDGGPSQKVLACLSKHIPFWDRKLELVILTHPEADHLTGLISVIERYNVKQLVSNSLVKESPLFREFRQKISEKRVPVYSPQKGDQIRLAGLVLKILWPAEKLGNELVWRNQAESKILGAEVFSGNFNETSLVAQLSFGQFDALLTGDIGFEQEEQIQAEPVEILKVAHHGSKYSTSENFLVQVRPWLAVISAGANNRYGHPANETLKRLRDLDIKILRTDLEGSIEIVSDGQSWYTKPK